MLPQIKIYIVTYNNKDYINKNLEYLFNSDIIKYNYEINIINNFRCEINPEFSPYVTIINNTLRPNFSTGHLSRNWNQAIINGFKDLKNPGCNIVVAMQDDTWVKKDWVERLIYHHQRYDFISQGRGDNLLSWLPQGVVNIGLFDERFCGIMHQETDYFLQVLKYHPNRSSVNDGNHKKLNYIGHYEIINNTICDHRPDGFADYHNASFVNLDMLGKLLLKKWGMNHWESDRLIFWDDEFIGNPPNETIPYFKYYPYFEKDINRLYYI